MISYILIRVFSIYPHFDLLANGQFVIGLNSDATPVDTRFLHVNMMSFLQIIAYSFSSPENEHGGGRTIKLHELKNKNPQTTEF